MRNQRLSNINLRYAVLAISFCVISIAYLIALAVVQIIGTDAVYDDATVRTVTISGLRGEIYDCKGRLIVGNSTDYDLVYEYGAMPDTYKEINAELLDVIDTLERTGNSDKLTKDYFPLVGDYPNVSYSEAALDTESTEYYQLSKVLSRLELDANTDAQTLAKHYITKYKLSDELYSKEQIRTLMRLWYEMERADFGSFASYTIAHGVDMSIVTRIEERGIEGVTVKAITERVYYYPGVATHILGRVGKITAESADRYDALGYPMDATVGVSGCELAFESILRGQDGKKVIRLDDDGNVLEEYYEIEPKSGNDVWLTIDIELQMAAEAGLADSIAATGVAKYGSICATDPQTGAVLAIASYPTYDITQLTDQDYVDSVTQSGAWLNRVLQETYAPGSTYKIGVALAALETGTIDTSTTFYCNHVYPYLHNPTCLGTHGSTNIFDAIQESCNIFFYTLGHRMGIESITDYTKRLGLGADTGIELGDELGTVADPDLALTWGAGNDVSAAIGQSDHAYTPLQLSIYMSSIVNGGTRYSAHLLDSVRTFYSNDIIESYNTTVLDKVEFSSSTLQTLLEGMRRVVYNNDEIKWRFANVPVTVGGKTGTAQINGKLDTALFSGFAPLENPEIVVTCVIEEGLHGYYASSAVAKVMEVYFKNAD